MGKSPGHVVGVIDQWLVREKNHSREFLHKNGPYNGRLKGLPDAAREAAQMLRPVTATLTIVIQGFAGSGHRAGRGIRPEKKCSRDQ
jgi:hypothetical protein